MLRNKEQKEEEEKEEEEFLRYISNLIQKKSIQYLTNVT